MPIDCLVKPPEDLLLREVDGEFVKKNTSSYNSALGTFSTTIFPVQVIGKMKKEHPEKCRYQTLGGNHLRTAIEQLQRSNILNDRDKTVTVKVYRYVLLY